MSKVNKFMHGLYYNPLLEDYNHMYFFRIKSDENGNLEKLWTLTNKEILLLINIWIYNREKNIPNLEKLKDEKLNTLNFNSKKFKIYSSPSNIKTHCNKLAKLNLINKTNKFYYNFPRKCTNFNSFPLIKILHWLEISPKDKGLNTYLYLLFEFYNKFRKRIGKKSFYGVESLTVSHKEIGEKINRSRNAVKDHCDKIVKLGLIDKENNTGNKLTYHLPFYVKKDNTIVVAKTRTAEDIPKKIRANYNIEFKGRD